MTFPDAVRNVLSNYATFSGRARRSEYWWWFLAYIIVLIVADIIGAVIHFPYLGFLVVLAAIVPSLAVGARRLHDTGKSGWLQLIGIIPIIGTIVLIVLYCGDSQQDNQYGPNPKGNLPGGMPGGMPGPYGQPNPYGG